MIDNLDINCDLGEGYEHDSAIMPLIQSCNIACGGHAGDEKTIRRTIRLAKKNGVKIGAHPSYPDRENFGRKKMDISSEKLSESLLEQIDLFAEIARQENTPFHHIKLHGALYNEACQDQEMAEVILRVLEQLSVIPKLYTPQHSILGNLASDQFEVIHEVFIDRRYQDNLQLKPRNEKGALILGKEDAWKQYYAFMVGQKVRTETGKWLPLNAQTACIHGDSPQALTQLRYIQQQLAI
jgi:UPF0271 protein